MDPQESVVISESIEQMELVVSETVMYETTEEVNDSPVNPPASETIEVSESVEKMELASEDVADATEEVIASPVNPPESEIVEICEIEEANDSPVYPPTSEIEEISVSFEHMEAFSQNTTGQGTEVVNDSPIEEVRLTVPITDDPALPCLTIRVWVLGMALCVTLSFLNQFFSYRKKIFSMASVAAQLKVLPLGKLMATYLPKKEIRIPGTGGWSFSLSPGPFSAKEHCLISIFAGAGSSDVVATGIVTLVKVFYHHNINLGIALLLTLTTQMLGYGWAGIFRKFLVDSPYMWWPASLVQVSFFRVLHENETRRRGGLTRRQFFFTVLVMTFSYQIIPSFLFPSIRALSFICWIWKDSVIAQQIGAGRDGLGVGSIAFDWSTIASPLGSPLVTPAFAIMNMLVGFALTIYVIMPIAYWNNFYDAKRFPIISSMVFDYNGQQYNMSRIMIDYEFNVKGYDDYSKLYLSIFSVLAYGIDFASLAATLAHVGLFHGRTFWRQTKASYQEKFVDIHTRLMGKNYEPVPQWWFHSILVLALSLTLLACEGFGRQLQLRYWGFILAMCLAFIFTLPLGVVNATTNQRPAGIELLSEMVIGYIYPGRPIANVIFKTYSTLSMSHALVFIVDFKLGNYMKIPPKSMFFVQLVGTVASSLVHFGTSWWLLGSVDNLCDPSKLPKGSPWTCPVDRSIYSGSMIWGVVGPLRLIGSLGLYPMINLFFLFGLISPLPVWYYARKYPEKRWIGMINLPILISAAGAIPIAKAVNYTSWFAVGLFCNVYVYRRFKGWWARHNYILSAGLDAGVAFMTILSYFALRSRDIQGPEWWGSSAGDHCPLASCPTELGIRVEGCPVSL